MKHINLSQNSKATNIACQIVGICKKKPKNQTLLIVQASNNFKQAGWSTNYSRDLPSIFRQDFFKLKTIILKW